jgi:radical SAM superfamily enzyme YgiQ (UPF0313 family)
LAPYLTVFFILALLLFLLFILYFTTWCYNYYNFILERIIYEDFICGCEQSIYSYGAGMRYITEYCRTKKLPVELLEESINTPILNCLIKITEQKPDVVGLSVHIWNRNYVFQLIKMLRQVLPKLIIMVGGPEVMFAGTKVQKLLPQVNYVICGEGEELVSDLLTNLVNNEEV